MAPGPHSHTATALRASPAGTLYGPAPTKEELRGQSGDHGEDVIVKATRLAPAWANKARTAFYRHLWDHIPVNSTLFLILRVFEEFLQTERLKNENSINAQQSVGNNSCAHILGRFAK